MDSPLWTLRYAIAELGLIKYPYIFRNVSLLSGNLAKRLENRKSRKLILTAWCLNYQYYNDLTFKSVLNGNKVKVL